MIRITSIDLLDSSENVFESYSRSIEDWNKFHEKLGYKYDNITGWWIRNDEMVLIEEVEQ